MCIVTLAQRTVYLLYLFIRFIIKNNSNIYRFGPSWKWTSCLADILGRVGSRTLGSEGWGQQGPKPPGDPPRPPVGLQPVHPSAPASPFPSCFLPYRKLSLESLKGLMKTLSADGRGQGRFPKHILSSICVPSREPCPGITPELWRAFGVTWPGSLGRGLGYALRDHFHSYTRAMENPVSSEGLSFSQGLENLSP